MGIAARIVPVMPTRPCLVCLGLQDDSVFADFDADENGRLFLRRISFDGYGCCHAPDAIGRMDAEDSDTLRRFGASAEAFDPLIESILHHYFRDNGTFLWLDALAAHGLIESRNQK